MPLPKIKHPIFEFTVPSTGKKEAFRPFLVKEEKILLMAKASEDSTDILRAIKQVVNNCALGDLNVDKLAIFDIEYLFIQLRAISVNNIVKVSYRDNEDQEIYDFEIDLKEIKVQFPDKINKLVKITNDMGIQLRYPPASIFNDKEFLASGDDVFYELIVRCIDKIYDGDDIYDPTEYSKEEIEAFLDDVGVDVFEKVQEFITSVPKLYHKLEYKNKNNNVRVIELTSLADFFTLV